ncbi:hypothetical protein F5Y11DRAFT_367778 [Daldinia sp. FL1419]|nr:hypothetical protein F5Y11DRAFT_367778 [Daldinia sp. FL1419]
MYAITILVPFLLGLDSMFAAPYGAAIGLFMLLCLPGYDGSDPRANAQALAANAFVSVAIQYIFGGGVIREIHGLILMAACKDSWGTEYPSAITVGTIIILHKFLTCSEYLFYFDGAMICCALLFPLDVFAFKATMMLLRSVRPIHSFVCRISAAIQGAIMTIFQVPVSLGSKLWSKLRRVLRKSSLVDVATQTGTEDEPQSQTPPKTHTLGFKLRQALKEPTQVDASTQTDFPDEPETPTPETPTPEPADDPHKELAEAIRKVMPRARFLRRLAAQCAESSSANAVENIPPVPGQTICSREYFRRKWAIYKQSKLLVEETPTKKPVSTIPETQQPVSEQFDIIPTTMEQPTVSEPTITQSAEDQSATEQPISEQLVTEEPVIEQPLSEESITEEPVTEKPVSEKSLSKQSLPEQPIIENPPTEQPIAEEPVSEQHITEKPVLENPLTEQSIAEEPVSEQSLPEQRIIENPPTEQSLAEKLIITEQPPSDQPITEKPLTEQPLFEKPVSEQPVSEKPITEEPLSEQTIAEEPITEQSLSEKSFTEQSVAEKLSAEQPIIGQPEELTTEQPIVGQAVFEQSTIKQSLADQPLYEQPITEYATVEKLVLKQPLIEQTATQQAVIEPSITEQPTAEHSIVEQPTIKSPTINDSTFDDHTSKESITNPSNDIPPTGSYHIYNPLITQLLNKEPHLTKLATEHTLTEEAVSQLPSTENASTSNPTIFEQPLAVQQPVTHTILNQSTLETPIPEQPAENLTTINPSLLVSSAQEPSTEQYGIKQSNERTDREDSTTKNVASNQQLFGAPTQCTEDLQNTQSPGDQYQYQIEDSQPTNEQPGPYEPNVNLTYQDLGYEDPNLDNFNWQGTNFENINWEGIDVENIDWDNLNFENPDFQPNQNNPGPEESGLENFDFRLSSEKSSSEESSSRIFTFGSSSGGLGREGSSLENFNFNPSLSNTTQSNTSPSNPTLNSSQEQSSLENLDLKKLGLENFNWEGLDMQNIDWDNINFENVGSAPGPSNAGPSNSSLEESNPHIFTFGLGSSNSGQRESNPNIFTFGLGSSNSGQRESNPSIFTFGLSSNNSGQNGSSLENFDFRLSSENVGPGSSGNALNAGESVENDSLVNGWQLAQGQYNPTPNINTEEEDYESTFNFINEQMVHQQATQASPSPAQPTAEFTFNSDQSMEVQQAFNSDNIQSAAMTSNGNDHMMGVMQNGSIVSSNSGHTIRSPWFHTTQLPQPQYHTPTPYPNQPPATAGQFNLSQFHSENTQSEPPTTAHPSFNEGDPNHPSSSIQDNVHSNNVEKKSGSDVDMDGDDLTTFVA